MKVNRFGKKYCKIVLTGGPCAGKTTAQKQLQDLINIQHSETWQSFIVSEASSLLYHGGVHRSALDDQQILQWQEDMVRLIFQFEKSYENIAINEQKRNTLIICDRGAMDPKVFTASQDDWTSILERIGKTENDIMDEYEAIIQLYTAPKEYYCLNENPYRRETYAEAKVINAHYEEIWKAHPNFHQVDNYDHNVKSHLGWDEKCAKIREIVQNILDEK